MKSPVRCEYFTPFGAVNSGDKLETMNVACLLNRMSMLGGSQAKTNDSQLFTEGGFERCRGDEMALEFIRLRSPSIDAF